MAQTFIKWIPSPKMLQRISKTHIWLYRKTAGIVGQRLDGLDICLLTTRGRKSGQVRTAPLPYFRDGERFVLIASNAGRDKHPAWFLNLSENPDVELQIGPRRLRARAREAQGDERTRIWALVTRDHPRFNRYVPWTDRVIPVVVLDAA
jgi:deazaflavin-dependent oxidoreductase (nitroreductase family)